MTPLVWYVDLDLFPGAGSKFLADHTNLNISNFLNALSGLRYTEQSSSEFPPETRRVVQIETWVLRGGGGVNRPHTSHALPRKAVQVERRCPRLRCPRLWRPRLWQDVTT